MCLIASHFAHRRPVRSRPFAVVGCDEPLRPRVLGCYCVCVLSMSRPAPLPSLGPAQLREGRRHHLCAACPSGTSATARRILRPRGRSVLWPPGNSEGTRAHTACARRLERRLRTYAEPSQGTADCAEDPAVTPAPVPPPSLSRLSSPLTSALATDHRGMFAEYDYALLPATEASLALARQLAALDCGAIPPSSVITIAGEVAQHDLSTASAFSAELRTTWAGVVSESIASIGITEEVAQRHLASVAQKLLVASPRKGAQVVHWDSIDGWMARDQLSILLYCTDGCQSTSLPRFSTRREFPWTEESVARYELQQKAHLLDSDWYHSVTITAGQVLIFRDSVPHFGTRNGLTGIDRRVFFSMMSPSRSDDQDASQIFKWSYIADAFGEESLEYARALVDARKFKPLLRLSPASEEAAIQCLKAHGLYKQYQL